MTSPQLPPEFTVPDYNGGTIANIPATVASLLNSPFEGLPPLHEHLWRPVAGDVNRVIVLLIDSFGYHLLQQERPRLEWLLARSNVIDRITSVFPSTTVAALSSLWTGFAPAQHGLVGLRLFFPEYAVLGQLISFTPNFAPFPDALVDAGTDPVTFLDVPGIAQQLATAGIATHSFKGHNIINSALSRMHDRGVTGQHGIVTSADLFVQLRDLLEQTAGSRLYVNAYWPAIDTLSHIHGPDSPSVAAELHAVLAQLKTELFDRLSPAAREGTVFFITGDHGQVLVPRQQSINLDDHPRLKELLLMRPAGEPRTAYLYARQGCQEELLAYLSENFQAEMAAMDASQALEAGLFGPEPHAPGVTARLGDIVATMREGHLLLTTGEWQKMGKMKGRHGGMTAAEMEVPWLGLRLDA